MTNNDKPPFVLALPKGRVMAEAIPLLQKIGIPLPKELTHDGRRSLMTRLDFPPILKNMADDFSGLLLIEVKNADIFSFIATGSADAGLLGRDIWEERLKAKDSRRDNIYALLDMKIGACRLSVAGLAKPKTTTKKHHDKKTIASKYPFLTRDYYQKKGEEVEILPLSGSLELAPLLNMAEEIVDLVATGQTLKDNGLVEKSVIMPITSLLMVNRVSYKTNPTAFDNLMAVFQKAL